MKKKILLALMLITLTIVAFSTISVSAETEEIYTYSVLNGEATITGCDKTVSGEIVIPDTLGGYPVTSIRYGAFSGCSNLTNISMPYGITSIEAWAFSNCRGLESITISDSVTSIGYGAFSNCSSLTNITIPDGITSIEGQVFSGCGRLANIAIPDSVTNIGEAAFFNCINLENITIPISVTQIGSNAFYNCSTLTSITIPNSVITMGNSVFGWCSMLENITLSNSIINIEVDQFRECYNLVSITIPDGVTSIGDSAFSGCSSLANITIPNSVTSIGNSAFEWCSSLSNVYYNGTQEDWDKISFGDENSYLLDAYEFSSRVEGLCGKNLLWTLDENGVLTISGTGKMYKFDHNAPWEADKLKIKKVVIENGVTRIGAHSFCGCKNLESVIIPASVIGSGTEAFYCDCCGGYVDNVYIDDIKSWCDIEFQDVRANPLMFGAKLYLNNELIENLVIPEEVTEIGWAAFYGCSSIKRVSISSGMIGDYWYIFNSCNNLEEIVVDNDNPTYCSIDGNLFSKDKKILYQYCNGKKDTKYIVPDSVTQIGDEAFFNCTNLQYVILPDSLTIIGNSCFNGCTSLKEIKIPNSVTEISWWTFSRCKSLTNITIPNTVVEIYDNAFNSCANLSDIYYFGTPSEWNDIVVGTNNNEFSNAKVHFSFTDTTVANGGKSFSITPINIERGKTVILALYNGEQFVEMQSAVYTGEAVPFTTTKTYTKAKVMVWDDITNLKPVCEVENIQ